MSPPRQTIGNMVPLSSVDHMHWWSYRFLNTFHLGRRNSLDICGVRLPRTHEAARTTWVSLRRSADPIKVFRKGAPFKAINSSSHPISNMWHALLWTAECKLKPEERKVKRPTSFAVDSGVVRRTGAGVEQVTLRAGAAGLARLRLAFVRTCVSTTDFR